MSVFRVPFVQLYRVVVVPELKACFPNDRTASCRRRRPEAKAPFGALAHPSGRPAALKRLRLYIHTKPDLEDLCKARRWVVWLRDPPPRPTFCRFGDSKQWASNHDKRFPPGYAICWDMQCRVRASSHQISYNPSKISDNKHNYFEECYYLVAMSSILFWSLTSLSLRGCLNSLFNRFRVNLQ